MSLPFLLRQTNRLAATATATANANASTVKTGLSASLKAPSSSSSSSSSNLVHSRCYATPSDKDFTPKRPDESQDEHKRGKATTTDSSQNVNVNQNQKSPPELAPLPKTFSMDVDMPDPSYEPLSISDSASSADQDAKARAGGGGGGRTGAKAKRTSSASSNRFPGGAYAFTGIATAGLGMLAYNYGREFEDPVAIDRYKDDPQAKTWFGRIRIRLGNVSEEYSRPVWEKLLPDPLPHPYQRPYTLVLDLDELLIHSEWTRQHGWRIAKRPGLDYFLGYLSQFYEIVIYTRQPFFTAEQVVDKLDPDKRKIVYSLYKDSCRLKDGKLCKDLESLNRDPSRVIVVDTEKDGVELCKENAVIVNPWKGEKGDKELLGLLGFLEAIGIYGIPDVRTTIAAYSGTHIPTEYARRQAAIKQQEATSQSNSSRSRSSLRLFGGGIREPGSHSNLSWYDQERKRYQDGYAEDEKYWRENGEKVRQQAKEEQERQIKEMKLNAWGFLTGAASAPPAGQPGSDQSQAQAQA